MLQIFRPRSVDTILRPITKIVDQLDKLENDELSRAERDKAGAKRLRDAADAKAKSLRDRAELKNNRASGRIDEASKAAKTAQGLRKQYGIGNA
ncbi:hypothetical protein IZ6_24600 [Terrihabitans soli]|uniref:Uncharacterized protein n=1 Tax=Terrihabitans soli TaxID=708113 RepID=A0A6S6QVX4_9HYPH|nr:hypothetical protein [Terrihabitans soli]BCJ91725.1 hypothetical protein IZ6_24600 [Terrihabitans soli]